MLPKIAGWAGWAAIAFVVFATLSPLKLRPRIPAIDDAEFLGIAIGDGQILGFALLGMLFLIAYPRHIVLIALIAVATPVLLELSQLFVQSRHARISDAVVKVGGGIGGIAIGWLVTNRGRVNSLPFSRNHEPKLLLQSMRQLFGAVQRKKRNDGILSFLQRLIALIKKSAGWRPDERSAFDHEAGVETDGVEPLWALDVESENIEHGVRYQPSDASEVSRDLDALPIQFEQFDFIDLGAGKGRALIVAAGYPFRRVIGIEFSWRLQEIAAANIARLSPEGRRCGEIACVFGDAADYEFAARDTVLFLYNPFDDFVMKKVIRNLQATFAQSEYRLYIIYHNPKFPELFDDAVFLQSFSRRSGGAIYAMKQ
ncbi:polymorphic outer membrane protein repeat-containing protein [Mesorhizobium albiziae]|uniref:Polymorphic outer membrane protein repeat-containing protein n=1 Tax=Neomesorhizobium albiziae TaxID=335020 RepID=A0A1I3VCB6_9HYPH|nr:class I SAM-dependent methyltransferase [Mesorhizobium albiziae]GLS28741.1 hypothetical protein GCM10007937_04480 [Mesorhizobium albiziae]SFJ91781.1 polymorphic outer membrane protein repeat-containing protein [Mesorhizobium albiziae]